MPVNVRPKRKYDGKLSRRKMQLQVCWPNWEIRWDVGGSKKKFQVPFTNQWGMQLGTWKLFIEFQNKKTKKPYLEEFLVSLVKGSILQIQTDNQSKNGECATRQRRMDVKEGIWTKVAKKRMGKKSKTLRPDPILIIKGKCGIRVCCAVSKPTRNWRKMAKSVQN